MSDINPEFRDERSFLVGREPSIDRRFRPRPVRQVRLFDENVEEMTEDESINDDSSTSTESALVYLRMRPVPSPCDACDTYIAQGNVLKVKLSDSTSNNNKKNTIEKQFSFTDVFHLEIPQSSVYENVLRYHIESEESCTLLTYGTSGSGKTYTLLGDESQPGMVPRAIEQIFTMYNPKIYPTPSIKIINGRITLIEDNNLVDDLELRKQILRDCVETPEMQMTRSKINDDHHFTIGNDEDISVLIWISFVEIYNENIYDLLEKAPVTTQMAPPARKNLKIVNYGGKVIIKGVTSIYVKSSIEALFLLQTGLQRASYASTSINRNSSRSHCIYIIDVLKFFRSGQFSEISYKFCDLAGSERLDKTGNVGSRLKEAQRINTSLHVLGRCLDAVTSSRKKNNEIIPFRESKLTMLLQAALLGKEKLTMIVNVMPTDKYYEENMHVLNFASIAKNIVFNQPVEKRQKQRCSFLLSYQQSQTATNDEELHAIEENIFLRSEVDRLTTLLEEMKASHANDLFVLEQEIREKLSNSHQDFIKKLKIQYENREKIALENQRRQLEVQFQKQIRRYEWEIEDLKEAAETKSPNKRRTLE